MPRRKKNDDKKDLLKSSNCRAKKKMKKESCFLRWDLIEAKLGKDDTKHLKDNSLDMIDLCDQGISAELVEHLAKVLKSNSSLKEIYLSNNCLDSLYAF